MVQVPDPAKPDLRRCHDQASVLATFGSGDGLPAPPAMPVYDVGDPLDPNEQAILDHLRKLIHELDPNIPPQEVKPDRTLWEIGYDSLGLVALRLGIKRAYGPELRPIYWLQTHSELPRIGCFARFLAANGARPPG